MRVAVIYNTDEVYVEFSPEKFRQLLKEYFAKTHDIDQSLDKIIEDIKKETRH